MELNCNLVKFGADNSVREMEIRPQKQKIQNMLSQTELNEINHLLSHLRPGHIVKDIASIAQKFGSSVPTVNRIYSRFKKEQHERIQQSAFCGEARTSQTQALGFAGQPSYFVHAPPLTSSVLANARGGRNLHEVRGRSRRFERRRARHSPTPQQQISYLKHNCFLASPQ